MDNLGQQHPQEQQRQNLDAIYAAQQAWRHKKLRERELRLKKKLARQANSDQSASQSLGAAQRSPKRAKTYDQGAGQSPVYPHAHTASLPAASAAFSGGNIRNDHQFQYSDVSGIPTSVGATTSAMLAVANIAPALSQDMFVDQEDAQRRWREQKLRELAEKKAKGTPSKRGRRKGNGSVNHDQSTAANPTSVTLAAALSESPAPISSTPLQNATAGMMSIARQQMVYGVELAQHDQATEQQLQGSTDTTTLASLMDNRMQREFAQEVEGAFQAARALSVSDAVAANISAGDDGNGLSSDAPSANTREVITAILASSGMTTNIGDSNATNVARGGQPFSRHRGRLNSGSSIASAQMMQNGAAGEQAGSGQENQEHFPIGEGEEDIMTAAADWQSLENINQS